MTSHMTELQIALEKKTEIIMAVEKVKRNVPVSIDVVAEMVS